MNERGSEKKTTIVTLDFAEIIDILVQIHHVMTGLYPRLIDKLNQKDISSVSAFDDSEKGRKQKRGYLPEPESGQTACVCPRNTTKSKGGRMKGCMKRCRISF